MLQLRYDGEPWRVRHKVRCLLFYLYPGPHLYVATHSTHLFHVTHGMIAVATRGASVVVVPWFNGCTANVSTCLMRRPP